MEFALTTQKIGVPVLWDGQGNFRGGMEYGVYVCSIIRGTVKKPLGYNVPGAATPVELVDTLAIKDPSLGELYLALTLDEYLELMGNANAGNDVGVINWIGDDTIPAGCTITSSELADISIVSINKGGTVLYPANYNYTNDGASSNIVFAIGYCLSPGEDIQIIFNPK